MSNPIKQYQKDFKETSNAKKMTMKEIHKPSSFEGAVWSVVGIKDARVVFHSPPGCYMMQHMNLLCGEQSGDMYCTQISYANVMMGTEEALEKVLLKVSEEKPKALIIVTSPVIEITGDDVEGIAKKIGIENTVIIRPPIGMSLSEGKEKTFLSLLDLMRKEEKPKEKSINLIGPTYETFNWRADVFELKRMLACINVSVNAVLTAHSTVEELIHAPDAMLNVCVYPYDFGTEVCRQMQKRFDIPYVSNHIPIGFRESAAWLDEIAKRLEVDAGTYLSEEIKSGLEFSSGLLVSNTLFESSAAICTDNCDSYSAGISSFLSREMGMKICMATVGTEKAAEKVRKVCDSVMVNPPMDEKKEMFLDKAPTIILGNYYDLKLSTDLGFKNFLMADIPHIGYVFSENRPFMGFMGAKNLVETITNEIYMKIFIETKGEMEGAISIGEVEWELAAERALNRIAEMLPHFVRSIAIKKIHQVADNMAMDRNSKVTMKILREVTNKYTPTRFKGKYATLFDDMEVTASKSPVSESPRFQMDWDEGAKEMLEMVPQEFLEKAVSGTEAFAKQNGHDRVTTVVVDAYRKDLGF